MIKNTAHYSAILASRYPDLPADEIHKLCLLLMRRVYGHAVKDHDIRIASPRHKLFLKIYKPYYSSKEHNEAAQQKFTYRWIRRRPKKT